jgi:hypothetical protein
MIGQVLGYARNGSLRLYCKACGRANPTYGRDVFFRGNSERERCGDGGVGDMKYQASSGRPTNVGWVSARVERAICATANARNPTLTPTGSLRVT